MYYSEEWELIDFKVNENYRTCCNDTPLYCECGKLSINIYDQSQKTQL